MWFWCPVAPAVLCGCILNCRRVMHLHCYRLKDRNDYDEESIWALVQRHGGYISIKYDHIDFWIAEPWDSLLVIAYPDLERHPELDYH